MMDTLGGVFGTLFKLWFTAFLIGCVICVIQQTSRRIRQRRHKHQPAEPPDDGPAEADC